MIDYNFIPESLERCREHYVPPIKKYISCKDFGNSDGMNGRCHWCREMTPYQWEMCRDETWVKNLLNPLFRNPAKTREEAAESIERCKQNS